MGLVSSQRMNSYFSSSFGKAKEGVNYTGTTGIGFRIVSFILFTTIIILFNIWYCSRNKKRASKSKSSNLTKETAPPPFNRTRKIILAVAGFFLLVGILAQVPWFADKSSKIKDKVSDKISSEFKETEHEEMGNMGKEMKFTKTKEDKKSYWGTFGKWEGMGIDCWLIIGAIIICLLAKISIMGTLTTAVQSAIPLVLVYIFAAVPATIVQGSGMSENLAKTILPTSVMTKAKYWALLPIFGLSMLVSFLIDSTSITAAMIAALAPTLASISSSVLIYAAIFAWVGGILGMAFSPNNGILIATLEKSKTTYKQFIKKTWMLGLIMLATAFGLVWFWTWFNIK